MGTIRVLLALAVVAFHTTPIYGLHMPDGVVAVQAFYVISGFYMSLILTDRYSGRVADFYANRSLRLYPVYWLSLLLTLAAIWFSGRLGPLWSSAPAGAILPGVLVNFALIGQDWSVFAAPSVQRLIALPQAWTLAVEITFYAFAPWLARWRTRWVVALFVASLVARHIAYLNGLNGDPWNYRFFPFELAFFLAGMLGHRYYDHVLKDQQDSIYLKSFSFVALAVVIAVTLTFQHFMGTTEVSPLYGNWARWEYSGMIALSVPFIFWLTRNSQADSIIGDFSYPIYMVHFAPIFLLQPLMGGRPSFGVVVAALSAGLAAAMLLLTEPIEHLRRLIASHSTRTRRLVLAPVRSAPQGAAARSLAIEPEV